MRGPVVREGGGKERGAGGVGGQSGEGVGLRREPLSAGIGQDNDIEDLDGDLTQRHLLIIQGDVRVTPGAELVSENQTRDQRRCGLTRRLAAHCTTS